MAGLLDAGVTKAGIGSIVWSGVLTTGAFIVLSPLFGFFLASSLVLIVSWVFVRSSPCAVEGTFQWLQFASASLISLGHGGNDAQKTMGITAVLLFSQGQLGSDFYVPFWVVITCQAAIGFGTLVGGWRIVHTVGSKITRLTPVQSSCATTAGAIMLFAATYSGIPVSTTLCSQVERCHEYRNRLDHHIAGRGSDGCHFLSAVRLCSLTCTCLLLSILRYLH